MSVSGENLRRVSRHDSPAALSPIITTFMIALFINNYHIKLNMSNEALNEVDNNDGESVIL